VMYDEVATHCSMGEHYADRFALPVFFIGADRPIADPDGYDLSNLLLERDLYLRY